MNRFVIAAVATLTASSAYADEAEHRELGAHEHGVGQLAIAVEGDRIAIELRAPGADIVGFEHAPESAEDRAAVDQAVATLVGPLALFVLPEAAGCSVAEAEAKLVGEDEHAHDEDEHAGEHGEHSDEHGEHSEFHAAYVLTCADPAAVTRIEFLYFEAFPNARELELELVTAKGAQAAEVGRDAPVLELEGMI